MSFRAEAVSSRNSWRGLLRDDLGEQARRVAMEVAYRLQDRALVESAILSGQRSSALPEYLNWYRFSLYQGDAGLALACGQLDSYFPADGWSIIAHDYLESAIKDIPRDLGHFGHLPPSLSNGLAGLAFAVWRLSDGGSRYQKLLATVDGTLLAHIDDIVHGLQPIGDGLSVFEYDLVSGVAGIAAYLLCRIERDDHRAALHALLNSLVRLSEMRDGLPELFTPSHKLDTNMRESYPDGNINLGLAHGVPGPIAIMALAHMSGVRVPGMSRAIEQLSEYLIQNRTDDRWGPNWPAAVPLAPKGSSAAAPLSIKARAGARAAWCYGNPGIARALWLAGATLERPSYSTLAVEAMQSVYRRPAEARGIDAATFCHGVAGLLQITLRFAMESHLPIFAREAEALTKQLLSLYEPDRPLGFRSMDVGHTLIDHAGLLEGAPAVVLVLLAASMDHEPMWDRAFLLS